MVHRLLADLVLLVHLLFILFVVLGGLFWLRWRLAPLVHLPCVIWGVLIELRGWTCPLTPLENQLRRTAGQAGYSGGFVEHYLLPLIYPAGLTPALQVVLALGVVAGNALVYLLVWRRLGRRRRREPA